MLPSYPDQEAGRHPALSQAERMHLHSDLSAWLLEIVITLYFELCAAVWPEIDYLSIDRLVSKQVISLLV